MKVYIPCLIFLVALISCNPKEKTCTHLRTATAYTDLLNGVDYRHFVFVDCCKDSCLRPESLYLIACEYVDTVQSAVPVGALFLMDDVSGISIDTDHWDDEKVNEHKILYMQFADLADGTKPNQISKIEYKKDGNWKEIPVRHGTQCGDDLYYRE